ncbi:hypothetical protein GOP47_0013074 [Adiantum capillus-veneris]|uniref:F-box domain-containing protein n=1 Tax=Adiantum capillus-veneris TaxID=13818 RepID=A0A9D4ZEY4_ADICA|nr:hypothetical protein GOP47_0013074 [Adiantum capillus-veneris]
MRKKRNVAKKRGHIVAGELIPSLPDELVLAHVVTRLPWCVRPVCRAVSKSWRAWMDTSITRPDLQLRSRKYHLPLLHACFLISTLDTHIFIAQPNEELCGAGDYTTLESRDIVYHIHKQWRKLPCLQGLLPSQASSAKLVVHSGMVYVWWTDDLLDHFVLKMDMACGDWTWKKFSFLHHFTGFPGHVNGKVFVLRGYRGEPPDQEKETVLVYGMTTEQCEVVKTWDRDI